MAKFNIGNKVISVSSNNKGIVVEVKPARRGRQLYSIMWTDGTRGDELEVNLIPDVDITDPYQRCINGLFGTYSEYSEKNTTFKIRNSNNSTISSLKASKTLFRAYQFKPLLKFLNSPNRRLLVADEVGLGKTIEAGHIMLELKARRELNNVLIICPKSLQEKWKLELSEKFGLTFKIYDSGKELISDLNDHDGIVRAIINYEKIRKPRQSNDSKKPESPETKLIDYLGNSNKTFSLVLCDEAHKLRNSSTQTYRGAEIIMERAAAVLFLTATPVMISEENLYNLLHLLDNTRYFNYQVFYNRLQENRPFVEAISSLNHNESLPAIAKALGEAEIHNRFLNSDQAVFYSNITTVDKAFHDDPIYEELKQRLAGEDTPANRARIQYLLSTMSVMNSVFSRTRKREVTTDMSQAERVPHLINVTLTKEERKEYDNVINEYIDDNSYVDDWGEEHLTQGGSLGLVQKKRQVASSVYAYLNSEADLDNGVDAYAEEKDAKFEELVKIIQTVFAHGTKKIVVFALFRKTLKYLQVRFKARGFGSLIIHGQIENRTNIVEQFRKDPNAHILLSSEVGSEGLDMQFCNSMVNYDLPWNPMVVEQRIGRIDRFGQMAPKVNIYNFVVSDSIQVEIYTRLLDRIGIFRGTIGDMEAILDAPFDENGKHSIYQAYTQLERELFAFKLTPAERRRKIEEIARAIENEKEDIRHLEEGLDNTLTNDAYFKDEISRILSNRAYVTEEELRNYLESVIRKHLTVCDLVPEDEHIYQFRIPESKPKALSNFLLKYHPAGEENTIARNHFLRDIEGELAVRVTFNQATAYDNRSVFYLNIYHPIIQSCLNYLSENGKDSLNTAFCYSFKEDKILKKGDVFYMGLYQFTTSRMVQGVEKRSQTLFPLVFDYEADAIVEDQSIIDNIYALSQSEGIDTIFDPMNTNQEKIEDIRYDFAEAINKEIASRKEELSRQSESDRMHNEAQTKEYYNARIENLITSIENWEWLSETTIDKKEKARYENSARLIKSSLHRLQSELESRLEIINENPKINIKEELLSLNLITII